jgi:two-component system sensor histidine kinase AlgZ
MIEIAGHTIRTVAKTLLSHLGINVVLAVFLTIVMAALTATRSAESLSAEFVANTVVANCVSLSFEVGFGLTVNAAYARRLPAVLRTLVWIVVFLACVVAGVLLALAVIDRLLPALSHLFNLEAVLLVAVPVSLVMMRLGYLREQREAVSQQKSAVEAQLAEARLEALSARTHPHFLFNSLNSIAALVEDDPKAGEQAILGLARMFRYVLEGSRSNHVPLADELDFVASYLAMERLRFGERLSSSLEVDEALRTTPVPPLLLQPLVENAVRHGMHASGRGRVLVRASLEEEALLLAVDDDGPGPDASAHRGAGTSHETLRARLQLLYGARASFRTASSPLGGFRAEVRLPREPP